MEKILKPIFLIFIKIFCIFTDERQPKSFFVYQYEYPKDWHLFSFGWFSIISKEQFFHTLQNIVLRNSSYYQRHTDFVGYNWKNFMLSVPVCDGTQNVKRYRYQYFFQYQSFSDTDPGTFLGTKSFRYWFQDFFPIPNFSDTGSEIFFFVNQFFLIPVLIPPKIEKIQVLGIPGTGTSHSAHFTWLPCFDFSPNSVA